MHPPGAPTPCPPRLRFVGSGAGGGACCPVRLSSAIVRPAGRPVACAAPKRPIPGRPPAIVAARARVKTSGCHRPPPIAPGPLAASAARRAPPPGVWVGLLLAARAALSVRLGPRARGLLAAALRSAAFCGVGVPVRCGVSWPLRGPLTPSAGSCVFLCPVLAWACLCRGLGLLWDPACAGALRGAQARLVLPLPSPSGGGGPQRCDGGFSFGCNILLTLDAPSW